MSNDVRRQIDLATRDGHPHRPRHRSATSGQPPRPAPPGTSTRSSTTSSAAPTSSPLNSTAAGPPPTTTPTGSATSRRQRGTRPLPRTSPAWRRPDALGATIELGIGALPAELAAWVHLTELVVHGADLAIATGQEALLDQGLAARLLEAMHTLGFEAFRTPDSFGTELDTSPDSLPHERLLAYLGRPMASVTAR